MSGIVFVDVDTQFDFMDPKGALYVPGAEEIRPVLVELVSAAKAGGVTVIATTDWHAPDDPEFQTFPPHCVRETPGAAKIEETRVEGAIEVGEEKALGEDEARRLVSSRALVVRKSTYDAFSNPGMDALVRALAGMSFVVFGVATDYCVRAAALGLLGRKRDVVVVEDAVRAVSEETGLAAVEEMRAKGAVFKRAAEVIARAR